MKLSDIGNAIRHERNECGLTQTELAEKMGISDKKTISQWENGSTIPKLTNIVALSEALNCSPEHLLGFIEEKNVETHWIAERIPLSEEAIEYLLWLKKACDDGTMEEHQLQKGMIDAVICGLEKGIDDGINDVVWSANELMTLLVQANRLSEINPFVNHTLFIRQAFCMALGGIAFDYINNLAKENMASRRAELEEAEAFIKEFDERMKQRKERSDEDGNI